MDLLVVSGNNNKKSEKQCFDWFLPDVSSFPAPAFLTSPFHLMINYLVCLSGVCSGNLFALGGRRGRFWDQSWGNDKCPPGLHFITNSRNAGSILFYSLYPSFLLHVKTKWRTGELPLSSFSSVNCKEEVSDFSCRDENGGWDPCLPVTMVNHYIKAPRCLFVYFIPTFFFFFT